MVQKIGTLQALSQISNRELYDETYVCPNAHAKSAT